MNALRQPNTQFLHKSTAPTSRYRQGIKLTGILYFHQITDNKMTGTLRKNFRMFQELCGGRSLRNVVIVTNKWEEVDRLVGERREVELKGKDMFFKPVLEKRAQMARHDNTVGSAQRILRLVLRNRPLPQRIQEEIVDQGLDISQTSAGRELDRDPWDQIRKHSEEMYELEEKRQQAMKDNDGKAKKRLMQEIKQMKDKIKGIENDSKRMVPDYQKMVLDLETHRTEIEKRLKESPDGGACSTCFDSHPSHRRRRNPWEHGLARRGHSRSRPDHRQHNPHQHNRRLVPLSALVFLSCSFIRRCSHIA